MFVSSSIYIYIRTFVLERMCKSLVAYKHGSFVNTFYWSTPNVYISRYVIATSHIYRHTYRIQEMSYNRIRVCFDSHVMLLINDIFTGIHREYRNRQRSVF